MLMDVNHGYFPPVIVDKNVMARNFVGFMRFCGK
jgi:hypothetical protein